MKKVVFVFLVGLLGFAGAVEAHELTRQKVTVKMEVNASPDVVWKMVGNFYDMSWHPVIVKTEGRGNQVKGAKRTLTLNGGPQIHEELKKHDDAKRLYSYKITEVDVKVLPVTNYSSWLSVEDGKDGGSLVKWIGTFYRGYPNNDPPEDLNDAAARKAVTGVYEAGLKALKARLETK